MNNIKFKENFEKSFEKLGVLKEKLILENIKIEELQLK